MGTFNNKLRSGSYIVIGDLMVDEYVIGKVSRISPEAPIPIINFESSLKVPGGAANVAMNLVGLGNHVELVGLIGDDEAGHWLKDYLNKHGVGTSGILSSPIKATTNKVRFSTVQQTILRVDYEDSTDVDSCLTNEMTAYIEQYLRVNKIDGVLVSDYNKGLFVSKDENNHFNVLFNKLVKMPLLCGVDTKKEGLDLSVFEGFDFIKPNLSELSNAVSMKVSLESGLPIASEKFLKMSGAKAVLVTLGADGLYYFDACGLHVPTVMASVYDVTGAGDTVFSVIMHSRINGLSWIESMRLANIAASVVIESRGTKAISISELDRRVEFVERTQPNYFIS